MSKHIEEKDVVEEDSVAEVEKRDSNCSDAGWDDEVTSQIQYKNTEFPIGW